jgi:hypothetical protein
MFIIFLLVPFAYFSFCSLFVLQHLLMYYFVFYKIGVFFICQLRCHELVQENGNDSFLPINYSKFEKYGTRLDYGRINEPISLRSYISTVKGARYELPQQSSIKIFQR